MRLHLAGHGDIGPVRWATRDITGRKHPDLLGTQRHRDRERLGPGHRSVSTRTSRPTRLTTESSTPPRPTSHTRPESPRQQRAALQKRLTIVATWSAYGEEREQVISTLLTETDAWSATAPVRGDAHLGHGADQEPRDHPDLGIPGASTGEPATPSTSVRRPVPGPTTSTPTATDARDVGENTALTNTDSALGDTRAGHRQARAEQLPAVLRGGAAGHSVQRDWARRASPSTSSHRRSRAPIGADVSVGAFTVTVTTGSTGGTPTPTGTSTGPSARCANRRPVVPERRSASATGSRAPRATRPASWSTP